MHQLVHMLSLQNGCRVDQAHMWNIEFPVNHTILKNVKEYLPKDNVYHPSETRHYKLSCG